MAFIQAGSTNYPYMFDGLTHVATYHKELSKKYVKEIIADAGDYHFQIKLPFADFVNYCLLDWIDSKQYFKEELRRYISGLRTDEYKCFRYIPISKGNYIFSL